MKTILIGSLGMLLVACGTAGTENGESGQAELNSVRTVKPEGSPTCGGWSCAKATRPVSDEEIFEIAARYEMPNGTPSNPGTVRLAALECAEINGSCEASSCSIRTTCGGGGPLYGEEARTVEYWLRSRNAPTEHMGFASRQVAGDVTCSQRPGRPTRCVFVTTGGGSTSSSSGGASSSGSSGGATSSSSSSGSSGATSSSGGSTPPSSSSGGSH